MEGSTADLRRQMAGLLDGKIDLNQFQARFALLESTIEQLGSDEDLDLLNRVENLLAEYTGNYITASEFLDVLRAEIKEQTPEFVTASRPPI